jgi:hypothetical protein
MKNEVNIYEKNVSWAERNMLNACKCATGSAVVKYKTIHSYDTCLASYWQIAVQLEDGRIGTFAVCTGYPSSWIEDAEAFEKVKSE